MVTVLGPLPLGGVPLAGGVEGLVDDVGVGGLEVEAGESDLRQLLSSETPTSLTSEEPPEQGVLSFRRLPQLDGTDRCGLGNPS